ncbi:MAG: UDP-glucose/GDP-mannose dehydrogenase family protein, partial [Gemmatimonadetes bacterium]
PPDEDGSADLKHVLAVADTIGQAMNGEKIVITKSTVPVGTAAKVRAAIEARTEHPVHVCSNPEFLKEGAAVEDFMKPDRVVLGVDSAYAGEVLRDLYSPFVRTGNEILIMDIASAEITKYAANAMLATRISFMNAIAGLCERTGADVNMVRHGIGSDRRIGPAFLFPGVGYGGSCFPKDVKALVRTMNELGADASILEAVEAVNERQKGLLLRQIVARFGEDLSGRRFAVWGLAFKPNTDDMREAPSLVTIEGVLERGGTVVAHDPVAMDEARRRLGDRVTYVETNYDALTGADGLVIHTEWHPYRRPDFERMKAALATPAVFDGRNLYDPDRMEAMGFEYYSVGRRAVGPRA